MYACFVAVFIRHSVLKYFFLWIKASWNESMRLRRRSNCAMNSGLIGIPARRYSALTDCYTTGSSGLDRRGSLPASVLRFTPLVKIERKISQFESPRCDVRSLKFDTTIEKTHIKRLLCLVGILVVFTFSAISYSFYKVLKKNYYIWISRMSCNNEFTSCSVLGETLPLKVRCIVPMHMSFGAVFFYFLHGLRWLQIYRKCRKQKKLINTKAQWN